MLLVRDRGNCSEPEAFLAELAGVRSDVGVDELVLPHLVLAARSLAARLALMRLHVRVNPHVHLELPFAVASGNAAPYELNYSFRTSGQKYRLFVSDDT